MVSFAQQQCTHSQWYQATHQQRTPSDRQTQWKGSLPQSMMLKDQSLTLAGKDQHCHPLPKMKGYKGHDFKLVIIFQPLWAAVFLLASSLHLLPRDDHKIFLLSWKSRSQYMLDFSSMGDQVLPPSHQTIAHILNTSIYDILLDMYLGHGLQSIEEFRATFRQLFLCY